MKDANRIKDVNGQFEDAYVITPAKRFFRRFANWLILLTVVVVLAGGWAAQHFYTKPRADEALVSQALRSFQESSKGEDQAKAIKRYFEQQAKRSAIDQMMANYELLGSQAFGSTERNEIEAYLASLRVAMRAGILEAKLEYGIALRDGLTGQRDSAAAVKLFDEVAREVDAGVRAGDPVAMYVQAQILEKGLGKEPDKAKASELTQRAVTGLDGRRLERAAESYRGAELLKGISPEFLKQVAERLIAQKSDIGLTLGANYCSVLHPISVKTSVSLADIVSDIDRETRIYRLQDECRIEFYKRGIDAGIESANNDYAHELLVSGEPLEAIAQWFARGVGSSSNYDRFTHAVVKAVLSSDDSSLMFALSELHKQFQSGKNNVAQPVERFQGGYRYFRSIENETSQRLEQFFITANVIGLVTDSLEKTHRHIRVYFRDRPTILARAFSSDVLRKSRVAARALIDGVPLATVKLGNDVKVKTFSFEEAQHREQSKGKKGAGFFDDLPSAQKRQESSKSKKPQASSISSPQPQPRDREQQDKTGYLKGQPQTAWGGLSTFTVDNRQGDRDAVARIYLNGQKPAVRSMNVKSGETFKALSIAPGNYVFRYRFIGSEDTFESNDGFQLTQTKTETGTRYSNVTVTLFKVQNGNMTTRKVTPDKF